MWALRENYKQCSKKNGFVEFIIPVFACQLAQDSELHQKKTDWRKDS